MARGCKVEGCAGAHYSRGMCKSHYNTWIIQTRPESRAKRRTYTREWARIQRHGDPGPPGLLRQPARGFPCSITDCEKPVKSKGLCPMHYSRLLRHGDPNWKPTVEYLFLKKVDRRSDDECWPWLGFVAKNGYGYFKANGKWQPVHRWAHELFVGPIPDGYHVDHVAHNGCTRKDCVNWVRHLEAVTPGENARRGRESYKARSVPCVCPTCGWAHRRIEPPEG